MTLRKLKNKYWGVNSLKVADTITLLDLLEDKNSNRTNTQIG